MLKKKLGFTFKRVRSNEQYVNSRKNIDSRSVFSRTLLRILKSMRIMINFDESVLNCSTARNMSWLDGSRNHARSFRRNYSGLSILLTVSSQAELIFKFLEGNNNEASVCSFLAELVKVLDSKRQGWRSHYFLLMDNCASHKTKRVLGLMQDLHVPYQFIAPASYLVAPVEGIFGVLKSIDFEQVPDPNLPQLVSQGISKLTQR